LATIAMTSSLAKETRDSSTADAGRVCSDGKSRENKCSGGLELPAKLRRGNEERPLYNEYR